MDMTSGPGMNLGKTNDVHHRDLACILHLLTWLAPVYTGVSWT
jgi:hypothetical protein